MVAAHVLYQIEEDGALLQLGLHNRRVERRRALRLLDVGADGVQALGDAALGSANIILLSMLNLCQSNASSNPCSNLCSST